MSHSILSPSGAKRWLSCPGSISLTQKLGAVSSSSAAADLGTLIHGYAEKMINEGSSSLKDENLQRNHYKEALNFVKYVYETCDSLNADFLKAEYKVNLDFLYPDTSGTADCVAISNNQLFIFDLKTGSNPVESFENKQLMLYALGIFYEFKDKYKFEKINLHIYQNNERCRADLTNYWSCSPEDLMEFEKYVKKQIENIFSDDPKFNPCDSNCQYCPAASQCKALIDTMYENIEDCKKIENDPSIKIEDVEYILENKALIERTLEALMERMLNHLQNGGKSEKFKLVQNAGKRVWKNEVETIAFITENCKDSIDDFMPRKLATPKQCLDMVDGDLIQKFEDQIYKKEGSIAVALKSDKRKEIKSISDDFDTL